MAPKAKPEAAPKPKAKGKSKAEKKEEEEPKMPPPDREEFDRAMAEIQERIDAKQKEQAALAAKIGERSAGKEEHFAKRDEYRKQLDEFTAKIDALKERKNEIDQAMGQKRQEGMNLKDQLNKMKKSIGYTSEREIDDRIATIEFKLVTDTLTLKQEKDFLKEISELKRNRPKVGQVHKKEEEILTRDTGASLRDNISIINEEMNLYRDGKRQVSQKMTELIESRKLQMGDLPKLIEERDAISRDIREEMDKRTKLRDDFRQQERDYNQWRIEERRKKQEKYQEARELQQAQWERERRSKKAEELDSQPFVGEITLLEQTILFCKNLIKDKGPEEKKEEKEIAHGNLDGLEVCLKKEDQDEFYYAPTSLKKKGRNKKGPKEGGKATAIKHNAESFKLFDQLKLNAPLTTEDIPATLEQLEAQLENYQEQVKNWEKNRDEMKQKIMAGEELSQEKEGAEEKEGEKDEEKEEKEEEE